MALMETYFDWLAHLSMSPGKQIQLWQKGLRKSTRLASHLARCMAQFEYSADAHCRRINASARPTGTSGLST
jgi:hypothetical protein